MNSQLQIEPFPIRFSYADIASVSSSLFHIGKDSKTSVFFTELLNPMLWYPKAIKKTQHLDPLKVINAEHISTAKKYPIKITSGICSQFNKFLTYQNFKHQISFIFNTCLIKHVTRFQINF